MFTNLAENWTIASVYYGDYNETWTNDFFLQLVLWSTLLEVHIIYSTRKTTYLDFIASRGSWLCVCSNFEGGEIQPNRPAPHHRKLTGGMWVGTRNEPLRDINFVSLHLIGNKVPHRTRNCLLDYHELASSDYNKGFPKRTVGVVTQREIQENLF